MAAEAVARQSTDRARRDIPVREAEFTIRDDLQHRFHTARANNNDVDEEHDQPSWPQEGVQELNTRLPSPRPHAPYASPGQTIGVELPTHYNVQSPSSFTAENSTAAEFESEIEKQRICITQVEAQLSKKDSQIRQLLQAKEATEEAHLQAILNGPQREIERLEKINLGLVEQLRTARADVKRLDAQVLEGRAREDDLRRQMHERERQMDERGRHHSQQIHNARLLQMQAEADLEAARLSPRLVTETVSQSSQQSQPQRRPPTSSHRFSSTRCRDTRLAFSVPRGSRDAPIRAELIRQILR
ncbi:MAG: hypothetical protein Q9195_005839 [Heterodermia aff. obscurata]